jgi:hypothetical protein
MKIWSVVLFLVLTVVLPVAPGENNLAAKDTRFVAHESETIWFMKGDRSWKTTGWNNSPSIITSITLVAVGFFLYFLPWAVASIRQVHADGGIMALNLFLGWSVIGWSGALIWAITAETEGEFKVQQARIAARAEMANIYMSARYS